MNASDTQQPVSRGVSPAFYIAGGTLPTHTPSYVPRQADQELLEGLNAGQFCYVLTSRQMGKSSLMVRTAARLREQGTAVAVLDLTAIGQNLSPDQWYDGLLNLLARSLDLEDEMEEFWLKQERLSPLQRWMAALREVALAHLPGKIVLFLDEIDAVRSLPFSADEFFAAIRECYNRRSEDPEYERLTFCLLGVATPGDLIREVRTTPFNIGKRILLTDFTRGEASVLEGGLGGVGLLDRVLYWTGGHPYLTQRLCQAVASLAGEEPRTAATVDRLCGELFLASGLREQEDNLVFVRDRILRSEEDLAGLLTLYGEVLSGKRVLDTEGSSQVSVLKLSGVVRVEGGRLRVRNRLYERVFGKDWVREQMPDAEFRRQRAAYRRGVLRAVSVFGIVLAVVGGLAVYARIQARRATAGERRANVQRNRAETSERQYAVAAREARRQRYAAQVNLAQKALRDNNLMQAVELLEQQRPKPGEEDLRGWAWRYLWKQAQGDNFYTIRTNAPGVGTVPYSPDGRTIAFTSDPKKVTLWDVPKRQTIGILEGEQELWPQAFTSDGKRIVTVGTFGPEKNPMPEVKVWSVAERKVLASLRGMEWPLAVSGDGQLFVAGHKDGHWRIWDIKARKIITRLGQAQEIPYCYDFSPDNRLLGSSNADYIARLWDVKTGRLLHSMPPSIGATNVVKFAPDGKTFWTSGAGRVIRVWDVATGKLKKDASGHEASVFNIAFSPDGKTVVTGGLDATLRVWDAATLTLKEVRIGHRRTIGSIAFSPDGSTLATSGDWSGKGSTVRLWNMRQNQDLGVVRGSITASLMPALAFSPDGKWMAKGTMTDTIQVWETTTNRVVATLRGHQGVPSRVGFSPDGKLLAVWGPKVHPSGSARNYPGEIRLWDIQRQQEIRAPLQTASYPGSFVFSPNGKQVAAACINGTIARWELPSWRALSSLKINSLSIWTAEASFSPDSKTLAVGSMGDLFLFDAETGKEIVRKQCLHDAFRSVKYSPDGKMIAVGNAEGRVFLWEVGTPTAQTFQVCRAFITSLEFSPDGKAMAVCGADGVVRILDTYTHQEVISLKAGDFEGYATFSPDGNTLGTASCLGRVRFPMDVVVKLWHAPPLSETEVSEMRIQY